MTSPRPVKKIRAEIDALQAEITAKNELLRGLWAEHNGAILAETGLAGHKASYLVRRFRGPDETRYFMVERASGDFLSGRQIKQDGTLGVRVVEKHLSSVTDCGPFEASK